MPYSTVRKQSLICFLLLTFVVAKAQINKLYTIENGLSSSGINTILQDSKGFLWLGTENGLNRFDGDRFTVFKPGDGRKNGLTENQITALCEDRAGHLWIGTHSGLWRYALKTEEFAKFPVCEENNQTHNFHVTQIAQTPQGEIIVSTSGMGICRFNAAKNRLETDPVIRKRIPTLYFSNVCCDSRGNLFLTVENDGVYIFDTHKQTLKHHTKAEGSLRENEIASLCESSTGKLYVGTTGGLYEYNYQKEIFELIEKSSGLIVVTLFPTRKGELYAGTDGSGIYKLNKNGVLTAYTPSNNLPALLINKIQSLIADNAGNIWCGIKYRGLELIGAPGNGFDNFDFRQPGATASDICIYSVYSNDKEVWFGSDGDGVFIFDRVARQTVQPRRALPQKKALSIYEDKNQNIWIGTWNDGLLKVNKTNYAIEKQYKRDYSDPKSICNDRIWAIAGDRAGNLWLGTSGGGLCRMDARTGGFSQFSAPEYGQLKANTLCNNWVNCLLADNDILWAGTADGLSKVDLRTMTFTNFFQTDSRKRGVWVKSMTKTGNQIWVGTNNGILIYDNNTGKWSRITDKELTSSSICALVADNNGHVWATVSNKIFRINAKNHSTHLYSTSDGIRISEFYRYAGCKAPDGRIYFGGINGGVGFAPQAIGREKIIGKPIFTELLMFNKPVSVGQLSGGEPVLTANINQADKITMAYNDCFFTIRFKIPDFISSDQVTYRYKMVGYDNNWQDLPPNKDKSATYTNLSHGEYKFVVRAELNNTFSEKQITVVVLPPWWATIWMKAIYLLLFALALYLYYRYNKNRAQERLDRERLNHLAELNEMKLQFFINISHEIRTPISLIINPLEKLIKEATDKNRDLFQMMHRNAQRLLNLVNQLMDIRKIDKGQFKLKVERVEVLDYLHNIAADFQFYTDEKRIELNVQSTFSKLFIFIDPSNFEKVIINLLSNAFRFSPPESEINIVVSVPRDTRNRLRIEVADSGIGIDNQILNTIFDRFVQGNTPAPKDSGTGVGLHLCRQLVQLHHGTITAQNRPEGKGAILTIEIPLGRSAYQASDLKPIEKQQTASQLLPETEVTQTPAKTIPAKTTKKQKPVIHIVEDDNEIRAYLASELSENYHIIESITATMAIKTIFTSPPDLILSDVMMPGMDGIDFCRKVRQNHLTSHIPIILLTAKSTLESIREGLEAGADDYMVKPFNTDILKTRIAKLLEMRRNLEYHFTKEPEFEMPDIEITSHNDKLMNKINEVLVQNLSDDRLNVTFLCAEVGISRVHLNRKMKELVNMPAQDYIRIFRLKHAANLLKENKLSVSEVAYAVGFSNPSHFSYRFRTFYGVTPTEFMEKNL